MSVYVHAGWSMGTSVYACVCHSHSSGDSYLCVYICMYANTTDWLTLQGSYFTVHYEILCPKYSHILQLHHTTLSYNYTMQPYQLVVCKQPHTQKITHKKHSVLESQYPKFDAWCKCYKFAVSKDIIIHYDL